MILTTEDILDDAKKRAGLTEDDTVLLRWMNEEYDDDNNLIARIDPDYFLTSAALAIVSGTSLYKLPATFMRSLLIEDASEVEVPKVSRTDPSKPDGWFFCGSVIESGVRYERIRIQPTPTAAASWTLWHIERPPTLDSSTNTVPMWPSGAPELLVFGILMRWMETEEEDERYAQYKALRDGKRKELLDLITDRHAGVGEGVEIHNSEDFTD